MTNFSFLFIVFDYLIILLLFPLVIDYVMHKSNKKFPHIKDKSTLSCKNYDFKTKIVYFESRPTNKR